MLRTEVVKSKNIRKTFVYKLYVVIAVLLMLFVLAIISQVFGEQSTIGKFINEKYESLIQPGVIAAAIILFVFSMAVRRFSASPKRLGSIEIDDNGYRFLINDELEESCLFSEINSVEFEFYSVRMRGNPMGCMNYLTFETKTGQKTYEIVINNILQKIELGSLLKSINQQTPVTVKYSYFLKRLFGDSDLKIA